MPWKILPAAPTVGSDAGLAGGDETLWNGDLLRADIKEYPYTVYHDEAEGPSPKFRTWGEALAKQVERNKDCPGHQARKRRAC